MFGSSSHSCCRTSETFFGVTAGVGSLPNSCLSSNGFASDTSVNGINTAADFSFLMATSKPQSKRQQPISALIGVPNPRSFVVSWGRHSVAMAVKIALDKERRAGSAVAADGRGVGPRDRQMLGNAKALADNSNPLWRNRVGGQNRAAVATKLQQRPSTAGQFNEGCGAVS